MTSELRASTPRAEGPPPLGSGAAAAAAFIAGVGLALVFLFIPQAILTEPRGLSREARVGLVTAWEAVAFFAVAFLGFRWSQR
jgi:hypothetical protein